MAGDRGGQAGPIVQPPLFFFFCLGGNGGAKRRPEPPGGERWLRWGCWALPGSPTPRSLIPLRNDNSTFIRRFPPQNPRSEPAAADGIRGRIRGQHKSPRVLLPRAKPLLVQCPFLLKTGLFVFSHANLCSPMGLG